CRRRAERRTVLAGAPPARRSPRRRCAGRRASGTTCIPAPRTQPATPHTCVPPARPSAVLAGAPPARRPARKAIDMTMPLRRSMRIGTYLRRRKLAGKDKFPLLVELEPLFACNLKCAGCGKIQQPHDILKQRMPVAQAIGAIEECGAPMVSIAGGEPLMHPQLHEIVAELIKRKKYVFLCTNALLIPRHLDKFKPSRYFAWAVHIDGLAERHDASVCKEGVFDEAVAAIKECQRRGFRVTTNTTFFNTDTPQTVID